MSTPENPPAFPVNTANLGGEGAHFPDSGMTLRDYFAAKALQGLPASTGTTQPTFEEYATCAYHHADAMLAARNRAGEEGR